LVASESAFSQHFLNLKTRRIDTSAGRPVTEINSPRAFLRGHLLLQFGGSVSPDIVAELKRRGIAVLQDVPENGLLVSVDRRVFLRDLGVRYAARIHPAARQLGAVAAQAEIQRAMAEWSKVVKIQWKPGTDPNGTRTVRILFATGAHGDGYPFDGSG